jgi:hypothetical protein
VASSISDILFLILFKDNQHANEIFAPEQVFVSSFWKKKTREKSLITYFIEGEKGAFRWVLVTVW